MAPVLSGDQCQTGPVHSPSAVPDHNLAANEMWLALRLQLPAGLKAITYVDVDLELAPSDEPGFARRPDVIVAREGALDRVRRDGGVLRASEVVVAVEVVSPGSKHTDRVAKRHEYSDAGIPHYWIVDLERPVSLLSCHLAGEFGYADDGEFTGTFATTEPFAFELDLDTLR
ncbi:MAG: Uma2 family endonuclease [Pseudonocardia sp.]